MRFILACALTLLLSGCGGSVAVRAACVPRASPHGSMGCMDAAANPLLTDTILMWQPSLFPDSNRQLSGLQLFGMTPQLTGTGLGVPSWTTGGRPAPPYAAIGLNVTTNALDVWTGSQYLSFAAGSNWQLGVVDTLGTGMAINGTTLTPQWAAGSVTAVSAGLSINLSHALLADWRGGIVTALDPALAIVGGTTLTPQWRAGTVTSLGTGLALDPVTHQLTATAGQWSAGTVATIGSGLAIDPVTHQLTATAAVPQWTAGNVSLLATGLSIVGGNTLTPSWRAATVVGLGTEFTTPSNVLHTQWSAGTVSSVGTGLNLSVGGVLTATGQWNAGSITAVQAPGLSIVGTTLTPQWAGGSVAGLGTEMTISSGLLRAQWRAGQVTGLTGLSIDGGGNLVAPPLQWTAGPVTSLGTEITAPAGVLHTQWSAGAVTSLGAEITAPSGVLHTQWSAGTVNTVGSGLIIATGGVLQASTGTAQWNAGVVNTLATGLTIPSGSQVLVPNWQAPAVTSLGAEITAPFGVLHTQWQAGTVTTIGSGLTLNPNTNTLTATGTQQWQAGSVTTLATGISIVGGTTLTPTWQAASVTSLGAEITAPSGVLHTQWSAGTVSTIGAGLTLNPSTNTLTATGVQQWTAGNVSLLATGLSIASGTTLTPQWQAGPVTSLGTEITATGGVLHGSWRAGLVVGVGAGLTIDGTNTLNAVLSPPITLAQGGTGATTQAAARIALGIDTLTTASGSATVGCFGSFNTSTGAVNATFTLKAASACTAGSRIIIVDAGQVVSGSAPLTVLPATGNGIITPGNRNTPSVQCTKQGGYFELISDPPSNGWDLGPQGCATAAINDDGTKVSLSEPIAFRQTTVAGLGTCSATQKGWMATVTDATAVTFNATPAGGGSNASLVMCTGSAWTTR